MFLKSMFEHKKGRPGCCSYWNRDRPGYCGDRQRAFMNTPPGDRLRLYKGTGGAADRVNGYGAAWSCMELHGAIGTREHARRSGNRIFCFIWKKKFKIKKFLRPEALKILYFTAFFVVGNEKK